MVRIKLRGKRAGRGTRTVCEDELAWEVGALPSGSSAPRPSSRAGRTGSWRWRRASISSGYEGGDAHAFEVTHLPRRKAREPRDTATKIIRWVGTNLAGSPRAGTV